jgi:hypothetical protein
MTNTLVITAILTAAALTGMLATTAMTAYATSYGDSSETNTEQKLKQNNLGSGESTNTNCAQNLINSVGEVDCFEDPTVNATDDD